MKKASKDLLRAQLIKATRRKNDEKAKSRGNKKVMGAMDQQIREQVWP